MFGFSKGPSGPGKSVGDRMRAGPDQYNELHKHHEAGQARKAQELATVASRAATDPQEKGKSKPAITRASDWVIRAAEASSQKFGRMFGYYGELRPDGTATVSQVRPVVQALSRSAQGPEQQGPKGQEQHTATTLPNGIAAQHSTLPGMTPVEAIRSSGTLEQSTVISPAVRTIYAQHSARTAHLGPSQQLASELEQADSRNRSVEDALRAKRQIGTPGTQHRAEKLKGNDVGRDIGD